MELKQSLPTIRCDHDSGRWGVWAYSYGRRLPFERRERPGAEAEDTTRIGTECLPSRGHPSDIRKKLVELPTVFVRISSTWSLPPSRCGVAGGGLGFCLFRAMHRGGDVRSTSSPEFVLYVDRGGGSLGYGLRGAIGSLEYLH